MKKPPKKHTSILGEEIMAAVFCGTEGITKICYSS